jgi:hypothetical protein
MYIKKHLNNITKALIFVKENIKILFGGFFISNNFLIFVKEEHICGHKERKKLKNLLKKFDRKRKVPYLCVTNKIINHYK